MLGYVRAAAAVPKLKVADCDYNAEQIMSLVNKAYESGVNVIVFPELCLTGYSCGDLFFQSALTDGAQRALLKLMEETAGMDMIIAVGFPLNVRNRIFNCAVLLHKGEILGVIPKTYLPNSEEFMEKRWFSPADNITGEEVSICGKSVPMGTDILFECSNGGPVIGVEICQDVWEVIPPSSYQALSGANVILNLTASNEVGTKHLKRRLVVSSQSGKTLSAYVFSASGIGESTTDMVFCGHSIIAENGTILNETKRFYKESQLIISDIDFEMINKERRKHNGFTAPMGYGGVKPFRFIKVDTVLNVPDRLMRTVPINPFVPEDRETAKIFYDDVLSIQSVGLARRMEHVGSLKCVLGLSGGLDSALALMVTVKALDFMGLDRKNLIAVVMPGFGTSQRTYENAKRLAYAMGVTYREISIKEACELHFKDIGHDINNKNVVFENVQARERTQILMDIANTENGLVVGTGDMSELALGFTTYNGDHMSMYNVNCGIPKTLARLLISHMADLESVGEDASFALRDIVDTPVSPELLPLDKNGTLGQITEEIVGPYEVNDFFMYYMLKYGFLPEKILYLANQAFGERYTKTALVTYLKNLYKRFFTQQYKRSSSPDGPKAIEVGLSQRGDWHMPSDASFNLWIKEIETIEDRL